MTGPIVPVILAGGSGTRLWPLSRLYYPKQFLSFGRNLSFLQDTVRRAESIPGVEQIVVVCNEEYRFLVEGQLSRCARSKWNILLETEGRNTAPATALAVMYSQFAYDDDCMHVVMPSDHVINDLASYLSAVEEARRWAEDGRLVTFGVTPTAPDTGFGYIEKGTDLSDDAFEVARFIEKPDHDTAVELLHRDGYFWNSGMFVFRGNTFLKELDRFTEIVAPCRRALDGKHTDGRFVRPAAQAWNDCPNVSIDYGVMEHTDNAVVVALNADWNDVGTWSRLSTLLESDENGNTTHGDIMLADTSDTCVYADKRLVTVVGVSNLIVIETADAVLVVKKDADQSVKQLVDRLRCEGHKEADIHTEVFRPWGSFVALDSGEGYQVKRLVLKPREAISLQRHQKRAEHWVVVKGEAVVTRDGEEFVLQANESTYIPRQSMHKLENRGPDDLEVIEVQTGSYLEEDDIERFEDRYGRS